MEREEHNELYRRISALEARFEGSDARSEASHDRLDRIEKCIEVFADKADALIKSFAVTETKLRGHIEQDERDFSGIRKMVGWTVGLALSFATIGGLFFGFASAMVHK